MSQQQDHEFSFDDVLKELKLNESELKRMVSDGELTAFKKDGQIKFKKEDVEKKAKSSISESEQSSDPTVILPLDENLLVEDFKTEQSGNKTEGIDETIGLDFADNETTETIDFSDDTVGLSTGKLDKKKQPAKPIKPAGKAKSNDDTLVTDEESGLVTESIDASDETSAVEDTSATIVDSVEDATDTIVDEPAAPAARRSGTSSRGVAMAGARPRVVMKESKKTSFVWYGIMIFSLILLIFVGVFFSDIIRLEVKEDLKFKPVKTTGTISDFFVGMFAKDLEKDWRALIDSKDTVE